MPEFQEPVSESTETIGSYLTSQCLQDRFGFSRRDVDSVLPITSSILKYREADVQPIDAITQEPRWPIECKVIQERVRHIDYSPPLPEPYYVPTGKEPKPKAINEDMGTVIYTYNPMSATNYFSRSCAGGTIVLTTPHMYSTLADSNDIDLTNQANNKKSDLKFESRFESGNLGKVIKITDTYYQLHLRRDLYTQRHMQWFYFRISNTRSKIIYRLSIVNFCKEDSLYNEGLRPLLYSNKDASLHAVGWRRCGDNITYYKNDSSDEEKEKHTLTFNISFPHDQDTVYLAHCYPYTYTDLQEYLTRISSDPVKSRFTKLRLLCRTLAGNSVHYLTITAPNYNDEARKKKGIVITARVHPGETPSSWMMKGIIDFLTGESNQARELRERFIFKLVPMLNPDGVIVGNNRCSLSGKDLNRQYRTVMRESYPSVWHTKLMIRRLMEECGISIYCDLHAHSRKHNIFIYGCESKRAGCYGKLTEQIFPLMLHKNAADKFSFENCKFHIDKGKEGTSRVVVWLMGVQNSYTMEASMGGSKLGSRSGTHFSAQDYEQIGKAFCETLLDFSDDDPTKERLRNKILQRLMKEGSSADEPTNINLTDYSSDEGDTSDSSSEDIKLATSEATILLDSETSRDYRSQYLQVPPPSPQLPKFQSSIKPRKLRKKTKMEESRSIRHKLLNRRPVMDLPATDPGSDMCCDLTDSADEYYITAPIENNPRKSGGNLRRRLKETSSALEKIHYDFNKKAFDNETLPLLRPHTLAFVEETTTEKMTCRLPKRIRGTQPARFMRHLSPILPRSQDVQIKLTSLRQIWTGVSDTDCNQQGDNNDELFNQRPLPPTIGWGVSQMALMCQKNSEALLKSCSKKLESLTSLGKLESKKYKKSSRNTGRATKSQPSAENPDEEEKNQKKKRIRFKRQKAVTSAPNPPEEPPQPSTTLSNEFADSLKLFGVSKLPKPQQKLKIESKKKFRRSGIVATATIHVSKMKSKTVIENYSDSSSSEEVTTINRRLRAVKKKKKIVSPKKRAHSANFLPSDKF